MDLAGVTIALRTAAPSLSRYFDWHFGGLPESRAPVDLWIELRAETMATPPEDPTMYDGPVTRWERETGDLLLRHDLGSGASLHGDVLILGVESPPRAQWRVVRQLLFSALSWYLDQRGKLLLHGAMVSRDGAALLLLGSTGGGKSTAAVAAALSGWELNSDDLVVVSEGFDGPVLTGVPKRAAADAEVAARLGRHLEPLPGDPRGRLMLPQALLVAGEAPLAALVTVEHDEGGGEIRTLPADAALGSLVSASLESGRVGVLRRHLRLLAGLAAHPHFRLAHAADPGVRVDRAAELLDEIWMASRRTSGGAATARVHGQPQ